MLKSYDLLIKLAQKINLTAFDVGARRGIKDDLMVLAPGVDFYGFEPDDNECTLLNKSQHEPWKSATFIPTALGENEEGFTLNLYRQRGCSSKLHANKKLADLFSRGDNYIREGTAYVPTKRLDDIVQEYQIKSPAFLKIDVEGMEDEVFRGAPHTLSESLVGIRSEVRFSPIFDKGPTFAEIDRFLRPYGFLPMLWLELHNWRRNTRKKLPSLGPDPMAYSRGQLIHGDILYLLAPENMPVGNEEDIKRLARLGLIATCYDLLDHAHAAFNREGVSEYCQSITGKNPTLKLYEISKARSHKYRGIRKILRKVCRKLCG